MNHKYNYNKGHSSTLVSITIVFLLLFALAILSTLQEVVAISDNKNNHREEPNVDLLDKGNLAEFFDFGTGIFAAILFALSLIAYVRLKSKRILYVTIAFAIFAIRVIVSKLDLFIPEIESSSLDLLLAIMGFAALGLFFLAIVKREKIRTRTIHY
jgi:hypothetical protein